MHLSHNQQVVGSSPISVNKSYFTVFFMVNFVSPSIIEVSSTLLFFVGVCGVAMNRRSVLLVLMSVEIMLLAVNIKLISNSIYLDDLMGQAFSLFVLTVAAAESSIGLAILVSFFRTRGSITIYNSALMRGLYLGLLSSKITVLPLV